MVSKGELGVSYLISVGIGVLGALVTGLLLHIESAGFDPNSNATLAMFSGLLLAGGYILTGTGVAYSDLDGEPSWRIAQWGTVGIGIPTALILVVGVLPIPGFNELRWGSVAMMTITGGGIIGMLAGTITELRAENARTKQRGLGLERQNERLNEFASVVSHDLQNPLTVINGRLELAREEGDTEHLASMADAVDRMMEIVDDTLRLAKHGQLVDEKEPVDLSTILTDSWQNVDTEGAKLNIEGNLQLQADPERLRSLFENLFRNAVDHCNDGDTVFAGPLGTEGFYLEDEGPGIPEADRSEVFQLGYSTRDGGSGFGLAIVTQIAEAHGWEISVTDGRAGGARFEVTGIDSRLPRRQNL